tara:strand:+ start:231 stop:803 length:573 start_codon:yes stop_codon:yes gene_type:complete
MADKETKKERKVTKDQLKNAGLTTGPKGLNKYLNKWNEIGKRPRASDFGSKKETSKKSDKKLLDFSDWRKQAPQDALGRILGPLDPDIWSAFTKSGFDRHGILGTLPAQKLFREKGWIDDEPEEVRRDRVVRQALKARKEEDKKSRDQKRLRKLKAANPSLIKERVSTFKKGGLAKKKKGMGTKWESKWG